MTRGERFYDWPGPRPEVTVGQTPLRLPIFYHDNDVFMSLHTASYDAVAAELPTGEIHPARWLDGQALVAVTAFRYHAVTWTGADGATNRLTPYGEISVAAAVTVGPAPRALPLVRRRLAGFVLHLPVTTLQARDGGLEIYGFPKFVADMDFVESPGLRQVELSEGGALVLRLGVRPGGPVFVDRRPIVAYTSLKGELLETVVPVLGHAQARLGGSAGTLTLGDHPVADGLRRLGISPRPVLAFNYLDHRSILPAGRAIAAAHDYEGYAGQDRDLGRFTVAYPGTAPRDQYSAEPLPA